MKRILARAAMLLPVLVLASALLVGALALSGSDPLLYADLSHADFEFEYVPQANSDYAIFLFSADGGDVHGRVEVFQDGEIIASGEGAGEICGAWLMEGARYTVRVHGSGNAVIEVARQALSRSYSDPLPAQENQASEKMIAHAYDAHWYAFEAQADSAALFTCVPEDPDLSLQALIFDGEGNLAGSFDRLSGGACKLRYETRAGETYYIRISAPDGGVGYYALRLHRPGQDASMPLSFPREEAAVSAGGQIDLSPGMDGALLWVSDDPQIAVAGQNGVVHGLRAGETVVTAYGMNGQASCRVRVEHVALEGVEIMGGEIRLSAGDEYQLQMRFLPEDASDRRLRFWVEDKQIASVSRNGTIRALQSGETMLHVSSADGSASDWVPLVVSPARRRFRALLVGEESYPFAENTVRNGSENSVQAIASLLNASSVDGEGYSVRTRRDLSRSELIAEIRDAFKNATPQDVSLLYITSHGSYSAGMSFLELSDGSTLSARDLERELRGVSGTVVVLIDCCGSGGAIGAASDRAAFAKGITGAFSGAGIRGSKYKVIASAGLDEDSFRIAFNENADTGMMATVFARALCDGAGWSIDLSAPGTMGADGNYDGSITLGELQSYMAGRVNWYLEIASALTGEDYRQSVQAYPEGDPLILFERKS